MGYIGPRASNELVFDQCVDSSLSVHVAGNRVNDDRLGSLESASAAAGAKLGLVAGHIEGGAIMGAGDDGRCRSRQPLTDLGEARAGGRRRLRLRTRPDLKERGLRSGTVH